MMPMKYASEKDCAAVSPVVFPPAIFLVSSRTGIRARATTRGSTPSRSSRTALTTSPMVRSRAPTVANPETLDPRYSAFPESAAASVTMRKPPSRFCSTSVVSESTTAPLAGTRCARNIGLSLRRWVIRAPTGPVVASTTTICRTPPRLARTVGSTNTAAKNNGPSSAITQNHRVRMRSTNSRRITTQTLRIRSHLGSRGIRADQVDEDLVQGRLLQLELRQPRPRRHQALQDLLWIGARSELQLGILPVVINLAHEAFICKHLRCSAKAAVEPDDEMVSAMCPLDVREDAVYQLPSPRDDAQLLAQLLRLLHDVGREQDRFPAAAQVEHRVLHDLGVHRIEARERLVENQEVRVVQHGRDELHLLLHPLRQLIDAAQFPLGKSESLEPCLRSLARLPPVDALHLAEEDEHVEHAHLAVQSALLREIADPLRVGAAAPRVPEYPHGAAVGRQNVHDHAYGGRLPGAVRPEQAVDHPARYGQRQLVNGGVTGEAFADPVEDQDRGRGGGEGGRRHVRGVNLAALLPDSVGQRVPRQEGALDADGEFRHTREGAQLAERLVPRGALVPLHHGAHAVGQGQRLRHRLVLQELRHHRGRGLADRAAPADEARILDDVAVHTQLQVDLVAAQRVVERYRVGRVLQRPLVAGPPVVIENQLLVKGAELRIRRGRIQTGLPP